MLQYYPKRREEVSPLTGKLSWSTAQAKSEAQGGDAESRNGASSTWLPAESSAGRQKRVDQESRKGVRQGKKKSQMSQVSTILSKNFP